MSTKNQQVLQHYLQNILINIKPKSKYFSEMHVEDFVDEIYMEILNGDTEIAKETTPFQQGEQKSQFEKMMRKKILSQTQKQKEALQQKLKYLSQSIVKLSKFDAPKRSKSSLLQKQSYQVAERREKQDWRKEIQERQKSIEKRKKLIEEMKVKKAEELKQIEQIRRKQQIECKKKQILESVKSIQERSKKRYEQIKQSYNKYIEMRKQKSLHQRFSESYMEKQKSFLEERKKKLAEIRNLRKPLDQSQLREHEQKFLQSKKQKQEVRQRQKRMNSSRASSLQPFYKSVFYQKVKDEEKNESQLSDQIKRERVKHYVEKIKQRYAPEIDQKKKQQIEDYIEKQRKKAQEKAKKEKKLQEKYKEKGKQYLEEVKSLPKKPRKKSLDLSESKTSHQSYPNYLTHTQKQPAKPWKNILKSSQDKQQKALLLQYQSQKFEEELKRKEERRKILKKGNSEETDQNYFEMIKAKLDLLSQN